MSSGFLVLVVVRKSVGLVVKNRRVKDMKIGLIARKLNFNMTELNLL